MSDPGGVATSFLEDVDYLDKHFSLGDTFLFGYNFVGFEIYSKMFTETLQTCLFALLTVICVVLFITVNLQVTIMVVFCVLLVDYFVFSFAYFFNLYFNHLLAINLSFALGIAVDYSVHIGHTYLLVVPPPELKTIQEKREYKARKAMSQMGSSVFHGGFSTFLAIALMGFAKLYTFTVFFRLWVTFIIMGMINGIILLPVLLSIFGPVKEPQEQDFS